MRCSKKAGRARGRDAKMTQGGEKEGATPHSELIAR